MKPIKKVLVLGSGALKIGQAGEFDYSGSQALKAFKEAGIKTVLVNPNIATIQTSKELADQIYFLPVSVPFVSKVIQKESPDAIALSFGGQTALNCGIELHQKNILKKNLVQILGTPIESVIATEDRQLFAHHMHTIHQPIPASFTAKTIKQAAAAAQKIGYPVMIRAAYALGGQSSGIAANETELLSILKDAFAFSPQVLVEQYLHHYKEIEYEVVRDKANNCVTVCNMENFDPLGIHTGESIVVAPSQTLTNYQYHSLRQAAIKIVKSLNIIGECNVQFALSPASNQYYVIEVNARLSRSSALASKATGYPLAYIAAKLALGHTLPEIKNQVTKTTSAFFEPALDYLVVKIPRWDLHKFKHAKLTIGSSMKSVGEVMAIGRTFEEAIQKAVRMLEIGVEGVTDLPNGDRYDEKLSPIPNRLFHICQALMRNQSIETIYKLTGIDPWFLQGLKNILSAEKNLPSLTILKKLGFSDKKIAALTNSTERAIRKKRRRLGILPAVFQIDTLAGEFPAQTNYLYMTYHGQHHDVKPLGNAGVMVLGSGTYRIGSSVEFDWACVNTANNLPSYGKKSIIVNCNPETVSTDYDISDRLYFEELTFERVSDIYDFENPHGMIIAVGGQTPNNLALPLSRAGKKLLGTKASDIDRAEDRNKFSALLDSLQIAQPAWIEAQSLLQAKKFASKIGYPVLLRPSYVLSGSSMNVCFNEADLTKHFNRCATISKFFEGAKEIELDGVAKNGRLIVTAMSEHIELAGVHSGDATIVYPPQKVYLRTENLILDIAQKLAQTLKITGPFNIQFLARDNQVFVIELNCRASRTLPFISKASGVNFAKLITDSYFDHIKPISLAYPHYVCVKVPQFSFARLKGADPILRVEMASTGEAACFGDTLESAFLKAELSVGATIPKTGIFLSLGGDENKIRFLESILLLKQLHLPIYATEKTSKFLKESGLKPKRLYKIHEGKQPNVLTCFQQNRIDLAINIVDPHIQKEVDDDYMIRRAAVDHNIYLLTNRRKAELFIRSVSVYTIDNLPTYPWSYYVPD